MSKKSDYSNQIIRILAENKVLPVEEIKSKLSSEKSNKEALYSLNRSLKGLIGSGLVESAFSGQSDFAYLTRDGKKKANSLKLEQENGLMSLNWDGFWRIIILDLPEDRKSERDALRYLLKKANFICIKNSMWISMFPYEHLFTNIKNDLGLSTEMMIFVTDQIDQKTKEEFIKNFGK